MSSAVATLALGAPLSYAAANGKIGTPVDDKDYQVPFGFTGKLAKLTIKLGPSQLAEAERKAMQEKVARARD